MARPAWSRSAEVLGNASWSPAVVSGPESAVSEAWHMRERSSRVSHNPQSGPENLRGFSRLIFTCGNRLSREAFQHFVAQGLHGSEAFRLFMRAATTLEEPRAGLLHVISAKREADPGALLNYWAYSQALGHLALLSFCADTGWFDEMLRAVRVKRWNPTQILVRERTMGLALRGAWMAGRLGESALGLYLPILRTPAEPLDHFNAVLALAMVALRCPEHAAQSKAGIAEWASRTAGSRGFRKEMHESVSLLLEAPGEARAWSLRWCRTLPSIRRLNGLWSTLDIPEPELLVLAVLNDAGDCGVLHRGLFPALLLLSHLESREAHELYPPAAALDSLTRPWSPRTALDVLRRSCPATNSRTASA